jgi:hypothetical protein
MHVKGCHGAYNAAGFCWPQHRVLPWRVVSAHVAPLRPPPTAAANVPQSNQKRCAMAISVKKVTLWRTEVENKPGALSSVLAPLAEVGADLQVVMGYRYHDEQNKAAIEICTVSGKKPAIAASKAGLAASDIPTLLVQGDNRPGVGHAIAQAMAEAGINVMFLVAQVIDARFSAVMGFEDEPASQQATALIKKAVKKVAQ